MCGIVGYVGDKQAPKIIYDGLKRLEYRGYDSAGIATLHQNGSIEVRREVGKLGNLGEMLNGEPLRGNAGIGHTRWATHGKPSRENAHPHSSMDGRIVLVHNGIIENFLELRDELESEGVAFNSETDTETVAHLIEKHLEAGESIQEATRHAFQRLRGANAFLIMSRDNPQMLITARLGNAGGIALGIGQDEMFVASDIPAILEHTRQMIFLENRQMAVITADSYQVMDLEGKLIDAAQHTIPYDPVSAEKGEYKHFMEKEIFEQPRAIIDTLRGRVDFEQGKVSLPEMNLTAEFAQRLKKIYIVACGTSYFAGLVGKFMLESVARIPVEVEYASEFRYYDPIVTEDTVVLALTQSGETADTLAACELARDKGATMWSIVNVIGSQSMRLADGYIPMHCGPEIGVASTKAFVTCLVDLYLLACKLAELRGSMPASQLAALVKDLAHLPELAGQVLEKNDEYEALANHYFKVENFLFLGRSINYPIALEGALKLKEISYIHAEGYPAGEMKHGPIALIDELMPVVAIATQDSVYEKMVSQIEQAKARGGTTLVVATEGDELIAEKADEVLFVPATPPLLAPIINVIPLQLLSYHIAVRRGCDVDQPRNLAKSVTVE